MTVEETAIATDNILQYLYGDWSPPARVTSQYIDWPASVETSRLGSGKTGTVYTAYLRTESGEKGTEVVLKLYYDACYAREGMESEVKAYEHLSSLQGNVIPKLYYHGNLHPSCSCPCIVIERIAGTVLGEFAKSCDREMKRVVMANVRAALNSIHTLKYYHYGIRHYNIIVKKDMNVVLIDLADARHFNSSRCGRSDETDFLKLMSWFFV